MMRQTVAITPRQQILKALTSPFGAAGVHMRLTTLFANDAKVGSYMRSFLHINANDLTFTDLPDGSHKAEFDVVAITFGDNGNVVDQVGRATQCEAKRRRIIARLRRDGFVYFPDGADKESRERTSYERRCAITGPNTLVPRASLSKYLT